MAMIGQDVANAFKALVIAIVANALYKSTLFMVAGIVDHETGTRDLRRLGGLRRAMPVSFVIAAVAGLSMAGLPPMFGFLAKETLLTLIALVSQPRQSLVTPYYEANTKTLTGATTPSACWLILPWRSLSRLSYRHSRPAKSARRFGGLE